MKISNVNNYFNYKSTTSKIKKSDVVKTQKYDTIQINNSASKINENKPALDLDTIKDKILADLNVDYNVNRMAQIKEQIANNSYDINTEELAKILLDI